MTVQRRCGRLLLSCYRCSATLRTATLAHVMAVGDAQHGLDVQSSYTGIKARCGWACGQRMVGETYGSLL